MNSLYTLDMNNSKRKIIHDFATKIRAAIKVSTDLVDMNKVVASLEGELEYQDLEDNVSGKIHRENGTFRIAVKKEDHPNRQRFTIAHELGHLFLHMGYLVNPDRWNAIKEDYIDSVYYRAGYTEEEYEANEFAAAFLMPEEEFRKTYFELINDGKDPIPLLANKYQLSEETIANRAKWLGFMSW